MVKKIFLYITTIVFLSSCSRKLTELILNKTTYIGNELRIDGYYYSDDYTQHRYRNVAVFYRNGVCIHFTTSIERTDTLQFIERDILLNKSIMSRFRNDPSHIGVFQIIKDSLIFEIWEGASIKNTYTFSHFGTILNDTTFLITKTTNNDTRKSEPKNLIYKFKQFNSKPDSTCVFITENPVFCNHIHESSSGNSSLTFCWG